MRKLALFLLLFSALFAKSFIDEIPYDKEKALLGKELFFDVRLSGDMSKSCQSCHDLIFRKDGISNSSFIKSKSVLNVGHKALFYYDGDEYLIRDQVARSLFSYNESGAVRSELLTLIEKSSFYSEKFKELYKDGATIDNLIDALVNFEKSILLVDSKFDKFIKNEAKLSKDELDGVELFYTIGCDICHNGLLFGENIIQNSIKDRPTKVPTLRGISKKREYFRDEGVGSLEQALSVMAQKQLKKSLKKDEIKKLKAFIESLDGEVVYVK